MTREQRTEYRRALQDELATVRAINGALRGESLEAERFKLTKARSECIHIVRFYLAKLHPPAPALRIKKPVRRRR